MPLWEFVKADKRTLPISQATSTSFMNFIFVKIDLYPQEHMIKKTKQLKVL